MTTTHQERKSVSDYTNYDKWRVCMRDSEGRVDCLPMCSSFHATEALTYSIRCVHPSIQTTLEPCRLLPAFLDVWYAQHGAKRVFKRCPLPSPSYEDAEK